MTMTPNDRSSSSRWMTWSGARSVTSWSCLELSTSTYLTLNGTAKCLWEGLTDATTVDGLIEVLVERYQISSRAGPVGHRIVPV